MVKCTRLQRKPDTHLIKSNKISQSIPRFPADFRHRSRHPHVHPGHHIRVHNGAQRRRSTQCSWCRVRGGRQQIHGHILRQNGNFLRWNLTLILRWSLCNFFNQFKPAMWFDIIFKSLFYRIHKEYEKCLEILHRYTYTGIDRRKKLLQWVSLLGWFTGTVNICLIWQDDEGLWKSWMWQDPRQDKRCRGHAK